MYSSLLSYWLTYFIAGYYFDDITLHKSSKLYFVLSLNVFVSCLITPFISLLSLSGPIFILPNDYTGYFIRWFIALVISDLWVYLTHRLFHSHLYHYHKMHHLYAEPHALAAFYVHPLEFIVTNYLSMMIPLILISHQELMWLETAFVAFDIIMSHIKSEHPSSKYHSLHHLHNNCNYGSLYIADFLFDTYR